MTFDELMDSICKSAQLSIMARILLPNTLRDKIKKALMKLGSDEHGQILKTAIGQIDHGSVESVDTLVRKQID